MLNSILNGIIEIKIVNEMGSEDSIYRKLQKKIHESTSVGFPASEDGTDINIK